MIRLHRLFWVLALALAGCGTPRHDVPRLSSQAWPQPAETALGRAYAAQLAAQPGRTHFEAHEPAAGVGQVARDHALNRETRCALAPRVCPADPFGSRIIRLVGEFRKRETEPAQKHARLQAAAV